MVSKVSNKKLQEFGIILGIFFPIFIGFIIPLIGGHDFKLWTLFLGLASLILAILNPKSLLYPYKFWMKFGLILGFINSHVILGLVFIFVLIPISIVMKMIGYDPLNTKKKNLVSYKEFRKIEKIDLNRIF